MDFLNRVVSQHLRHHRGGSHFAAFCFFSGSRADFLTSRTRKVRGLFQYGLLHDAQNTGSLGNLGCHAWPQRLQVSVGNTTVISIVFLTLTAR